MLIPILGAIVILFMLVTYRARMRTRNCRWREDRSRDSPDGRYFICMTCGAETRCESYRPPQACQRSEDRDDAP